MNDTASEDKRTAILLNATGPFIYHRIRRLVSPAKVTDVSFEEIVEKAKEHFNCLRPSSATISIPDVRVRTNW
jgi:hypothetical protein